MNAEKKALKEAPDVKEGFALDKTKDLIELVGKFVIGLLALAYAVGLIVINIYLNSYGVYSLSLFRLNYILAGFWVLSPILTVLFLVFVVFIPLYRIHFFRKQVHELFNIPFPGKIHKSISVSNHIQSIFLYILLLFFIAAPITWVIKNLGIHFADKWYNGLTSAMFLIILALLMFLLKNGLKNRISLASRLSGLCLILLITLILSSVYIFDFANNIYGTIPPYLGGGGTKDVQLLLKLEDKEKKFFETSGLGFQGDTNQTQTLQLLFANDNEYVFLVKAEQFPEAKGSTLSIQKDLIQAVLYEGLRSGSDNSGSW